jgi:hypothetical protein
MPLVALATCAALPDLDEDERLVVAPLAARGIRAVPAVWDDPAVAWAGFDLVVIRSTWDYTARREEFVAWARRVPRLANPADIITWNTDKHYLAELSAAGIPVVPTAWMEPGDAFELPAAGRHVVKPAVGAGSLDAATYLLGDPTQAAAARQHAERLLASFRSVMVQPYLSTIDMAGETGLVFVRGEFSHAINKSAMLGDHGRDEVAGLYKAETITADQPTAAEMALARRVLAATPGGAARLTYARIDLVPAEVTGEPLLIELELTEPSLFMATAPGSEERFAEAIVAALG